MSPRFILPLLATTWSLGLTPLLAAQDTKVVGGSGGTAYTIRCPAGAILTGLQISSGHWIDRVSPYCAPVTNILTGSWDWNKNVTVGGAGKEHFGNTTKAYKCGSGEGLEGFRGTTGSYVNSLILRCSKLGRSWRTGTPTHELARAGGSGGTSFPTQRCGGSMPAVGIAVRAGEYVDAFGLLCEYIMPIAPAPQAPVGGIWVKDNARPTFYWNGGAYETSLTICVNRTAGAPCSAPGTISYQITEKYGKSYTPSSDLPYFGNPVHWSLNACNDNGCRSRAAYFNYTPPR